MNDFLSLRTAVSAFAVIVAVSICHAQEPDGAVRRLTPQLTPPQQNQVQRQQVAPRPINPVVNPAPAPAAQQPPVQIPRAAPATEQRIRELIALLPPQGKDDSQSLAASVELVQIGQPALPYLDEAVQSGDGKLIGKAAYVKSAIQNPQVGANLIRGYTHLLQQRGAAVAQAPHAAAQPQVAVAPVPVPDLAALPQLAAPVVPAGPQLDLLEVVGVKLVATRAGLQIAALKANSPASRVGFAEGDIFHKVNGKIILGLDDAKQSLGSAQPGDVFEIEAFRGAESFKLALPIPKPGNW